MIALDTETTGLKPRDGHRVIEVGMVEIINRKIGRTFEQRINPMRDIDDGAYHVHGISRADLAQAPPFAQVAQPILDFIGKADILGHNLPFDLDFLDSEFNRLDVFQWITATEFSLEKFVRVDPAHRSDHDTMQMMKRAFPGKRKSLNALCDYTKTDRSGREVHGALKDAMLTSLCWLAMTRGGIDMFQDRVFKVPEIRRLTREQTQGLVVIEATPEEIDAELALKEWMMDNPFAKRKPNVV